MEKESKNTRTSLFWEIFRFLIVGGIATVIDMVTMGVVLYLFDPDLYEHFYNVFYGGGEPSVLATVVGTGCGFIVSFFANYFLSVIFVFSEKGNSRNFKGFFYFFILSLIGLIIHLVGMYIGYDLLHINEWIVKIALTVIVMVYNYVTKRILIFNKKREKAGNPKASDGRTE